MQIMRKVQNCKNKAATLKSILLLQELNDKSLERNILF